MTDCVLRQNSVDANGGAIVNGHQLALEDCLIEDNRAGQVGGGVYSAGYTFAGLLTIRDSVIRDNLSTGGGGLYVADTDAVLENVSFIHNAAFGTPTSNSYGGALSIKSSNLTFNVEIQDSVFADNYSEASGGAIFSSNSFEAINSEFRNNRAAQRGGAIFTQLKAPRLSDTLFYGNWAGYEGGAIFQNFIDIALDNSALFNNEAVRSGGGMFVNGGEAVVENVTFSGNIASQSGGALYLRDGFFGNFLTFANNQAPEGSMVTFDDGHLSLGSTAIGAHSGSLCFQPDGTFTTLGHNVISSSAGCTFSPLATDLVNVDPQLGPLADNGGPVVTLSHTLNAGSPAIDAGDPASCPSVDQRSVVSVMDVMPT